MSSAVIKFIITANYNYILQQLQLQQLQLQQLGTTTIQIQFTIYLLLNRLQLQVTTELIKAKSVLGNVPNFFTFGDKRRTTCHEHVVPRVTSTWYTWHCFGESRDTDRSRDADWAARVTWYVLRVINNPNSGSRGSQAKAPRLTVLYVILS